MAILKQIIAFIRAKLGTFVTRNTSVEDQYTGAANTIIDKITQLRNSHVLSINEEKRIRKLASEKVTLAESTEKEIRRLLAAGQKVGTHAKLGLLYRRTAEALLAKADEYITMRIEIEQRVVELDDTRKDLAVKLEYIRETRSAAALGVATAEDVVEIAALTKVAVEDTLMKIETFHGTEPAMVATESDVEEYLANLK